MLAVDDGDRCLRGIKVIGKTGIAADPPTAAAPLPIRLDGRTLADRGAK